MKYFVKITLNTNNIYFINAIQNVLKKKIIKENNVIKYFYDKNKNYYYLIDSIINDSNIFYKNIEENIKEYEKYIKNIYPEFLNNWEISFVIY